MASRRATIALTQSLALLCALSTLTMAQQTKVAGTVKDPSGAAISSARVTLHSAHKTEIAQSNSQGRFEFSDLPDLTGTLEVTANGFTPATQPWSVASGNVEFNIVLDPFGKNERVVVSASRS